MVYIVEVNHGCDGTSNCGYLKHDKKFDFKTLRRELFGYDKLHANSMESERFVDWLIKEKGFERLADDEYEFFSFED